VDPIVLLLIAALAAIYLIPTWVALGRNHRKKFAIFMLNLLLGWTLLGWVGALVWACMPAPRWVPLGPGETPAAGAPPGMRAETASEARARMQQEIMANPLRRLTPY
jgi:Superinfection immunity protein